MTRRLDDWIKHYLAYTQYSEAPESFHFWTAVGTIAGALRRKVYIKELYYDWSPNFYIILVTRPGLTKSTALSVGERFLSTLKGIKFGPNAMTWQALVTDLAAAHEMVPMADGTFFPMSCLTFYSGEFGTLVDFRDVKMIDVLVELWDGKIGAWKKATKTMGADKVVTPWVNIMAATTPAWLSDNLPKQMLGGGFTSRCIFIFADKKRHLVAYPSRTVVDTTALEKLQKDLAHDLELIATLRGEVKLTEAAYEFGTKWYAEHNVRMEKAQEDQGGYLARKQTHMHKLAIVLSAAKRNNLTVDVEELVAAERLLGALETDMQSVFSTISTRPEMEQAVRLVEVLRTVGKTRRQDLYRRFFFNVMSLREFDLAIDAAVQAGHVVTRQEGSSFVLFPSNGNGQPI